MDPGLFAVEFLARRPMCSIRQAVLRSRKMSQEKRIVATVGDIKKSRFRAFNQQSR